MQEKSGGFRVRPVLLDSNRRALQQGLSLTLSVPPSPCVCVSLTITISYFFALLTQRIGLHRAHLVPSSVSRCALPLDLMCLVQSRRRELCRVPVCAECRIIRKKEKRETQKKRRAPFPPPPCPVTTRFAFPRKCAFQTFFFLPMLCLPNNACSRRSPLQVARCDRCPWIDCDLTCISDRPDPGHIPLAWWAGNSGGERRLVV
ncbi:hypothetical protein LX36DRAFT_407526 [Colletotrichum falcatum]|nr:hypothetical protein LX36DRAFT_407526 [Colletotrichum falcatum]